MSIEAPGSTQLMRRTGWLLSGMVIAFMIVDAGGTLLAIEPLKKATLEIGYPLDLMWLIGALSLICPLASRSAASRPDPTPSLGFMA